MAYPIMSSYEVFGVIVLLDNTSEAALVTTKAFAQLLAKLYCPECSEKGIQHATRKNDRQ